VIAQSEPRFTQNVDIVLRQEAIANCLPMFLAALSQSDFIFDQSGVSTAIKSKKMFQLFDSAESLKLNVYPRELIPGELARSSRKSLRASCYRSPLAPMRSFLSLFGSAKVVERVAKT
jgi:hypothetical protein